jgi:thioredoxin-related protein
MKYVLQVLIIMLSTVVNCHAQIPAQNILDFEFSRLDSSPFTNKDLGYVKMYFFMFIDPDCEHCQRAMKNIDQQYRSFLKTGIYLISLDENNKIRNFVNSYAKHLIKQKNVLILRDAKNQFITKFKPYRYPGMFLYSGEGKLLDYEDNSETIFRIVNSISKSYKP